MIDPDVQDFNDSFENFTTIESIGEQTLVGFLDNGPDKPVEFGNCFTVACADGCSYRILNFYVENLEKLYAKGISDVVVAVMPSKQHAVIADKRIGDRWYNDHLCKMYSPFEYLTFTQKLLLSRKYERGDMQYTPPSNEQGIAITKTAIGTSKNIQYP